MNKKLIIIIIALFAINQLKAQYLADKMVLPKLEIKDSLLQYQLDSLIINYPCSETPMKDFVYFMSIKEKQPDIYLINIAYALASDIEENVNTGIYKIRDMTFVIREESDTPLFKLTKEKEIFKYRKLVMPTGDNPRYLIKASFPVEHCIWSI